MRHTLIHGNCLAYNLIDNESVDLTVTSPPYNIDKDYGDDINDNMTGDHYWMFLRAFLFAAYDWTKTGGRLCVNIAVDNKNKETGRNYPTYAAVVENARAAGWNYQTTICWNKQILSTRRAWGSWCSSKAPHTITPFEMIVVFYKGEKWSREWPDMGSPQKTMDTDEFLTLTNGMWTFSGERGKDFKHPARFPLELPQRCIKLFSFEGDTVLDPFLGSGTTMEAAIKLRRKAIGIELSSKYHKIAFRRLKSIISDIFITYEDGYTNKMLAHETTKPENTRCPHLFEK